MMSKLLTTGGGQRCYVKNVRVICGLVKNMLERWPVNVFNEFWPSEVRGHDDAVQVFLQVCRNELAL